MPCGQAALPQERLAARWNGQPPPAATLRARQPACCQTVVRDRPCCGQCVGVGASSALSPAGTRLPSSTSLGQAVLMGIIVLQWDV